MSTPAPAADALAVPSARTAACWYAPTLWHTMSLPAWLRLLSRHGFGLQRGRWRVAAGVTLSCTGNSLLGLVQQLLHGAALRRTPVRHDPIFVLGHWRSGTTHLHELLALDERFAFPTALECFAPHHCLLSRHLHPALLSRWLPRAPDLGGEPLERPQEDELALVALGAPSPLWSLAYPGSRHGRASLTLRDLPPDELDRWTSIVWQFLRLVTYRHPGRRLVLKSPAHTARLALLARMFPRARFLHIVRDPCVVFSATLDLWRRTHPDSVLLPLVPFDLERHVLATLKEMYTGFDNARDSLPPNRFHQIYYEQLQRDPLATLADCYRAMGLGDFEVVRPRIARHAAARAGHGIIDEPLSDSHREAVADAWGPIFRPWGYEI